jgi:hypothetical protein
MKEAIQQLALDLLAIIGCDYGINHEDVKEIKRIHSELIKFTNSQDYICSVANKNHDLISIISPLSGFQSYCLISAYCNLHSGHATPAIIHIEMFLQSYHKAE